MSTQKQKMLGSAIQSFNDCIYVVLSSGSHWWQTFMTAWGWNPWPSMQLCNSAMRLIFWETLVDSTWYNAEILLGTGEDRRSMRPRVPKGMKTRSSTLALVILAAFISHHLLVKAYIVKYLNIKKMIWQRIWSHHLTGWIQKILVIL